MSPTNLFFKSGLPNDDFIKRKTLLGFYYFLISIVVRVFFGVVNLVNPKGETDVRVLFLGVIFSALCLILLRMGWVNTSIIIHLIFSNVIAFRVTYQDPDQYLTGTYIYFIPAILWALAIFGYQQRWIGLGFSFLSVALFLIAIFDPPKFRFDEAHFYFIMNFTIVMVIGMIILTYYSKQVSLSEKELREKNIELEKANVELDRFVYSASHDLRAPISSLLGLIQLYHLSPPHEKDKMVSLMEGRIRKLDEFVREIIQYSRNARQGMNLSLIRPFELVNGCWERLRFMPQKIKIQFINETDPLLQINHDADRLRMIIENLVSNGIKYAKARPEPSFISVAVFENDNQLHITVADNGIGIEKTKREKVFEMFYRAHEISDGSGLGLYIVKEMVIKMQGQIELTSEEVQGTTFKIRLPLIKTNDVPEQEAIHAN